MELIINNYEKDYTSYKQELDIELNKAADGFVKIGYLLKVARDTNILAESGYRNVSEFAKIEYGLSKDVVSRYININDRYSQDGNSPFLAERYQGFGLAKLAEMLTLPDAIAEEITADTTKEEIRIIKKEYAEEQEISDIELAIEKAEVDTEKPLRRDLFSPSNHMENIIYDWLHVNPDEYLKLNMTPDEYIPENLADIIAPSGNKTIISRVPGVGKLMMNIRDAGTDISVTNMRTGEKETYTWNRFKEYIYLLCCPMENEAPKELWENIYNEKWTYEPPEEKKQAVEDIPKKETVSKNKPEVKKRKESKVTVVKKEKKTSNSVKVDEKPIEQTEPVTVEVVPGVEAEIVDMEKATEAAEQELIKAEIETVPSYTAEEDMNKEASDAEVAPVQLIDNKEPEEHTNNPMPKELWNEAFEAYYNTMDDSYQLMKKMLRNKNFDSAVVLMQKVTTAFGQIIALPPAEEED